MMSDAMEARKACRAWPCMGRSPRSYASMPVCRGICFGAVSRTDGRASDRLKDAFMA